MQVLFLGHSRLRSGESARTAPYMRDFVQPSPSESSAQARVPEQHAALLSRLALPAVKSFHGRGGRTAKVDQVLREMYVTK